MIEANLAYDYVGDIPWTKYPAFAFSNESSAYIKAFESVVDKLPVAGQKVSFASDIWDFIPYFDGVNHPNYKLIFEDAPREIKDYCKFFVLHGIMGRKKISTVNVRYSNAKYVLNNIIKTTPHKSIYVITTEDIIDDILSRDITSGGKHAYFESIYQFYYFLINNYKLDLPVDIEEIKRRGIENKKVSKAEDNKLPNIPEEYFDAILSMFIRVMRDETSEYNERVTACICVMLTQLGLRIGDLLALRTNQLHEKKLAKTGKSTHYIHYKSKKPSKPNDKLLEFDIFSNELCTEAFKTLQKIRKRNPKSRDTDFLFILDERSNYCGVLPIDNRTFNNLYMKLMLDNLREIAIKQWEGISPSLIKSWPLQKQGYKYAYIPDTRQYRVHLCTSLYEQGVKLPYIQRYMGHLSEYMLGYYVRPKNTYQENIVYSEKVIKEIVTEDLTPLGGSFGHDIKKSINDFIEKNQFNVQTDISSIVDAFGDKIIIRGKTGGVCIKTSLMPCSKDARTNEMHCAYNVCPNLFHFYYMADVTYMDFKTLQDTYSANLKSGKQVAAEKELIKIKDICKRRLLPELEELDNELVRKGQDKIIERYPSLIDIIINKDTIKQEVQLWMSKN